MSAGARPLLPAARRAAGQRLLRPVVIVTKDFEARERVPARLKKALRDDFVGIDGFVHPLDLGPPVGRPIQYRLSGPDIQTCAGSR